MVPTYKRVRYNVPFRNQNFTMKLSFYSLVILLGTSSWTLQEQLLLEEAIVHALLRYGLPSQLEHTTLLIESFNELQNEHIQRTMIERILQLLQGRLVLQFNISSGIQQPAGHNLILVDGESSFRKFTHDWTMHRYDLNGCYWIVLSSGAAFKNAVNVILKTLWKMKILMGFVFLVNGTEEEVVQLFTYRPYSQSHCASVKPIEMRWKEDDLFSDRLKNFWGCPLKFGTFDNAPYIEIHWNEHGQSYLEGFEGLLTNVIAKNLNFTIDIIPPPDNGMWGYPREDGNSTGLMRILQDSVVDFAASSLGYTTERSKILTAGLSHYNSYIVFAVPSGRAYTSFEKLFLPFRWNTWYAIFSLLLVAVLTIILINIQSLETLDFIYGRSIRAPISNLFNVLFGGPLVKCPQLTFARTLLGLWLLYSLVIRAAYQCSLYKYLQVPKNFSAPLTIEAMLEAGLYFYMVDLATEFFSNTPEVLARARFISHAQGAFQETIDRIGRDELDGAMVVLTDHIAFHNKFYPPGEFVHCSREVVCGFPMSLYYPKLTFLRKVFDREVQLIDSSGLVNFWASQLADFDFYSERKGNAAAKPLNVDNLFGAFEILLVLEGTASVMFVLELLAIKLRLVRWVVDWMESD
ncbi:uncharacterized protein LOC129758137 [Uranotaenia lowii]|uniref:uncharacterized protein LOC129758137 n=1 Tax=Uranotaenia lowii TaxID=190385 RepID=UPI0024785801|nr:uncharacterized protein LOC129758137 [Uranotaenia lowii]